MDEDTKVGIIDAIEESVFDAFTIPKDDILEAIQKGVYEAIWHMITNSTATPSADFYDAIRSGVEDGIVRYKMDKSS